MSKVLKLFKKNKDSLKFFKNFKSFKKINLEFH